jgi:CheY-like chemotaxis protein
MTAPAAARSALLPARSPQTILVVDDDAAMRMILGVTLTGFGYFALVAENGKKALQVAHAHSEIRVILLDVVMGGLSGKELADQLRISLPDAAIVFCSGHPPEIMKQHGIDSGTAHFMQKPCLPAELHRKIEDLLSTG